MFYEYPVYRISGQIFENRIFNIWSLARYRIAEKWPDFTGYRILNQISGPSLIYTHYTHGAYLQVEGSKGENEGGNEGGEGGGGAGLRLGLRL